ncbi:MAG: PA2778 family cysteine peptidase [Bdellovibrionota bacterium]
MKCQKLLFLFFAACLAGCASNSVQTDALDYLSQGLKTNVNNNAPFIEQKIGHCGPATLAMAIAATGSESKIDEITSQVYSPQAKGSLQENMISAARRQGFLAIPISGFSALLKELQAGHVVIVFENLGIRWIPQWHYALVTGYDLKNKTLVMHTGPNPNQYIDMAEFELSWKLTNYWALVVLPPGKVSASSDEITQLQAAAVLEKMQNLEAAKKAYLGILAHWPNSLIARIGLGNVYYNSGDYWSAVRFLQTANKLYPDSIEARKNLQVAKDALGSD